MLDRYALEPMKSLWSDEENKFKYWLKVELAVLRAKMEMGTISNDTYEKIEKSASFNVERIKELEVVYEHDMIAFITNVQEFIEQAGYGNIKEEFHKGVTSYDIEDPAMVLLLRRSTLEISGELKKLIETIWQKAEEHKWTLMISRTHGQYAEPSTFGHLLKVSQREFERNRERLGIVFKTDLSEGKISGAVGIYGGIDPKLEELALQEISLNPAKAETQILQRDRHASLLSTLAIIAGSVERLCRTFWEMMRSDVGELQEPRKEKQRGSSAMPQKKNPILTERLMGMPRLIRAYANAAMENMATPEGRDISQSSVERHIFPDSLCLTHYMLIKLNGLISNLVVFPEKMEKRLKEETFGVWAAQRVRIALMEAGISYSESYDYVQRASFFATEKGIHLSHVLKSTEISVMSGNNQRTGEDVIGKEKIQECFDPIKYIHAGVEKVFSY